MTRKLISQLSRDGFMILNARMVRSLGSEASVMLSYLIMLASRSDDLEGWTVLPAARLKEELGFGCYAQQEILKKLQEAGLIEIMHTGKPPERLIRICWDEVEELMKTNDEKCDTEASLDGGSRNASLPLHTSTRAGVNPKPTPRCKISSLPHAYGREIEKIWNHWNGKGKPLTKHRYGSKTAERAFRLIYQTLKQGYTTEQILHAIDLYHFLLTDPCMKPCRLIRVPGWKVGLDEFFQFRESTRKAMQANSLSPAFKGSWFNECMKGKAYLIETYGVLPKDIWPELTEEIRKRWRERVEEPADPEERLQEESCFRIASRKWRELLRRYQGRWRFPPVEDCPRGYAGLLFECLDRKWGWSRPRLADLTSARTWERELPEYAREVRVLE